MLYCKKTYRRLHQGDGATRKARASSGWHTAKKYHSRLQGRMRHEVYLEASD